jgi:NAD(P)-dependent dehydrogenase (short-subunit alcohol dehydrogenase family)
MQPNTYDLRGKVAIVTGGGKGLGRTLTQYLLEAGMKVAICSRNRAHIDQAVSEVSAQYADQIFGDTCDIRNAGEVQAFVSAVVQKFGAIHVLINNTGFGKNSLVWETSEEDWDEVMDTNLKGTFLMCKYVIPHMITQKDGYVMNIASQAALHGYTRTGVYCASKFGMLGFGKALQEEVREHGIHVHSINPALIQSHKKPGDSIDTGLLQNEDLGATIVFLLQQPRRVKFDNVGLWGIGFEH